MLIPAGWVAETVHDPAAEPDHQCEKQPIQYRAERHNRMPGKEDNAAKEDGVKGREVHQRAIGKIVDHAMVMNILSRAQVYDGVRRNADPPMTGQ